MTAKGQKRRTVPRKNPEGESMKKRAFGLLLLIAGIESASAAFAADRWTTLPAPPPMPTATQSGYAPVNGIQMYYAVYGEGDPILFIHGGLAYADFWANQVTALSKTHKVIVADSRGHGRSTRTSAPFGYDLMASDYIALLDYLGIQKTALVGWSDGGIIGLDIAMSHPERLTKLFAQAANVTTDGVKPDVLQNPTFSRFVSESGEAYKRLSKTPTEYDAFVAQISHMWDTQPNWTATQLAQIHVRTAIVLGDHDEAIKRDHTEYMASSIPGAKLIILKDVSHFAMLQDPGGYTKAILDFLNDP
jgi:pimeloyl-ACP methyl ester carboxylesterase